MSGNSLQLAICTGGLIGRFFAMGCPCELLVYGNSANQKPNGAILDLLMACVRQGYARVQALEDKFSRYRPDNLLAKINSGEKIEVDAETAQLLNFAQTCYQLSDGLFDITSGVLRRIWRFSSEADANAASFIPTDIEIERLLHLIGWSKVNWQPPVIQLPVDMQIDLGGLVKEYAVDQVAQICRQFPLSGYLINLGGDIYVQRINPDYPLWRIGIEQPEITEPAKTALIPAKIVELACGGVATSGSTKRFFCHQGKRYSHILNPKTGWPISLAPQSITVVSNTCTEAGLWSTLAMLHGAQAEAFLVENSIQSWCYW